MLTLAAIDAFTKHSIPIGVMWSLVGAAIFISTFLAWRELSSIRDRHILKQRICLRLAGFISEGRTLQVKCVEKSNLDPTNDVENWTKQIREFFRSNLDASYCPELSRAEKIANIKIPLSGSSLSENQILALKWLISDMEILQQIIDQIRQTTWDGFIQPTKSL
jgi:hypothetical protein